jgi:hypothetical protein
LTPNIQIWYTNNMIKFYAKMMEITWLIEDVLDIFWLNNTLDISSYWEDKYWAENDKINSFEQFEKRFLERQ